jgi:cytochrome b
MTARKPGRGELAFLLLFHAALSGAFLAAWLTGDEDLYGMHLFAGYTVLVTLGARLVAALLAPAGSPLALPRPSARATLAWLRRLAGGDGQAFRARSPLHGWMAVLMLGFAVLVAASGWVADRLPPVEDLHEALSGLAPVVVMAHVALVAVLHGLRRLGAAAPAATPAR